MQATNSLTRIMIPILFLVTAELSAKNYYLVYDTECMDRLAYSYDNDRPGNEFIVYAVQLASGKKIMMEVGLETSIPIKSLDQQALTSCTQMQQLFDETLATKINNRIDQVYIVSPTGQDGRYRIAAVQQAASFHYDGQNIVANSKQYRFDYVLGSEKSGDLSNGHDQGSVFYLETVPVGTCQATKLRQTYGQGNNHLDLYIVPEVGIIEERSNLSDVAYHLNSINHTPLAEYLPVVCSSARAAVAQKAPVTAQPETYNSVDLSVKSGVVTEEQTTPVKSHVVQKGETLFGIARKYQVSIPELKTWNQLASDRIFPGDNLLVTSPIIEDRAATTVSFTEKGTAQPQSYGLQTATLRNSPATLQPGWVKTNGQHRVQAGETVASIAQRYGFTEARFRYFNQLDEDTEVREGEMLRTIDCPGQTDASVTANPDWQTRGPVSYEQPPAVSNYTTPLNAAYAYTNAQNPVYTDEHVDFDQDYPDEFQPRSSNSTTQAPQSYGLPAGLTPRSAAVSNSKPKAAETETTPVPSNYGPIPGAYNNNESLPEPQTYQDPTNYENYLNPANASGNQSTPGFQTKGGAVVAPATYGQPTGQVSQNLLQRDEPLLLTGVKRMHTVKEGETLASIAARYGTTVKRLRALNNIGKSEVVIPFQQIYVQK